MDKSAPTQMILYIIGAKRPENYLNFQCHQMTKFLFSLERLCKQLLCANKTLHVFKHFSKIVFSWQFLQCPGLLSSMGQLRIAISSVVLWTSNSKNGSDSFRSLQIRKYLVCVRVVLLVK